MFKFSDYVEDKPKDPAVPANRAAPESPRADDTIHRSTVRLTRSEPLVQGLTGGDGDDKGSIAKDVDRVIDEDPLDEPVEEYQNDSFMDHDAGFQNGAGSLYDQEPTGAYEIAKLMGIEIPASREQSLLNASACLETVFSRLTGAGRGKGMLWPMVLSIAADLESIRAKDTNIATIIHRVRKEGEGLLWHSLYTSILAMELAAYTKVKLEGSVQEIGAAALLHDTGILSASGISGLMDVEDEKRYRGHGERGAELAGEAGAPEHVVTMIRQHHEQIDGKGFPSGILESEILNASQVIGISDIFEHAIIDISNTNQLGGNAQPGLSQVFSKYRSAYQTQLMKDMMALIGYYPVGSLVELSNRSVCEVIAQNQNMPLRPVVKVIVDASGNHPERTRMIDLLEVGVLSIIRAISSRGVR